MFPQLLRFPLLVAIVVMALPAGHIHSQAPAPGDDAVTALQTLSTANEDLLKRQADNITELKEMTETANQVKIFTKRG